MRRKDIIKKIKFMEEALKQGEKLDLIGKLDRNGKIQYFLADEKLGEILLMNYEETDCYVLLSNSFIDHKKHEIEMYIDSFCNCDMEDIINDKPCCCKLPTWSEGEWWWYGEKIKLIKDMVIFMRGKEDIKETLEYLNWVQQFFKKED